MFPRLRAEETKFSQHCFLVCGAFSGFQSNVESNFTIACLDFALLRFVIG